jgi:hypothetical protein
VSFEADGTTSGGYTAVSTVAHGTSFVLFIDTTPSTTCTLSTPGHTRNLGSSPAEAMDPGSPSFIQQWGSQWAARTYTMTVTCTRSGDSVSATKVVTIT